MYFALLWLLLLLCLFLFPVELHVNLNPLSHYYIKFSLLDRWTFSVKPIIFRKIYGGAQKGLPSQKTCHRYPTIIKHPKNRWFMREVPHEFCWLQHFFIGNHQILVYQELQIQIVCSYIISNPFNFFWVFKHCFKKMVIILVISAKIATLDLLKKRHLK